MIAAPRYRPWNVGLVEKVAPMVLDSIQGPGDRLALLASTTRAAPPGDGWRPFPWISMQVLPKLQTLSGDRAVARLIGEATRRLADAGILEIARTPLRGARGMTRGRIRFARAIGPARYAVDAEPLAVPEAPARRYYEPEGGVVVDHVARHLLALLGEEISIDDERDKQAASCYRTPPDDHPGWRSWPYLIPRLVARAGMNGGAARNAQVAAWAAWRLVRAGQVRVASSPIRESAHGRIRFARLAEASCS